MDEDEKFLNHVPSTLEQLFQERRASFFRSLEKILSASGSDLFIKQMFHSHSSAVFVPNRICEIVVHILHDDRELFIQELFNKVQAIEACFGPERAKEIEMIGVRLMNMVSAQAKTEAEQRGCIKLLRQQLSALQSELVSISGSTVRTSSISEDNIPACLQYEAMKKDLKQVKAFIKQVRLQIKQIVTTIQNTLNIEKYKIQNKISNIISENEDLKNRNKNLVRQIKQNKATTGGNQDKYQKNREKLKYAIQLIKEKDEKISQLTAENQQVDKLKKKLKRALQLLQNPKNEPNISFLQQTITEKDQEIAQLNSAAQTYKQQIAEKEKQLKSFAKSIHAKDQEITKLKNSQNKSQQDQLMLSSEKEQQIEKLQNELLAKERRINELTQENQNDSIDRLETEINNLKSYVESKDDQIIKLSEENERLKDEVEIRTPIRRPSAERSIPLSDYPATMFARTQSFFIPEDKNRYVVPFDGKETTAQRKLNPRMSIGHIDKIFKANNIESYDRDQIMNAMADAQNQIDEDSGTIRELESQRVSLLQQNALYEQQVKEMKLKMDKAIASKDKAVSETQALKTKYKEMETENAQFKKIKNMLNGDDNIAQALSKLKKEKEELERSQLKTTQSLSTALHENNQLKRQMNEVENEFPEVEFAQIPQKIVEMKENEEALQHKIDQINTTHQQVAQILETKPDLLVNKAQEVMKNLNKMNSQIPEDKSLHSLVSDQKDLDKILQELEAEDPKQCLKTIKDLKNVLFTLQIETETNNNDDLIQRTKQINSLVKSLSLMIPEDELTKKVASLLAASQQLSEIDGTLSNVGKGNLTGKITELLAKNAKQAEYLSKSQEVASVRTPEAMIERLQALIEVEQAAMRAFNIKAARRVPEILEQITEQASEIPKEVKGEFPAKLAFLVQKYQENQEFLTQMKTKSLDNIKNQLHVLQAREEELKTILNARIPEKLSQNATELVSTIKQLQDLTNTQNSRQMIKKVETLVANDTRINQIVPQTKRGDIVDRVTKLVETNQKLSEILEANDIVAKAQQLVNNYKRVQAAVESDNVPESVEKMALTERHVKKIIDIDDDKHVEPTIQKLVDQNKEMSQMLDSIKESLKDEDNIPQKLIEMNKQLSILDEIQEATKINELEKLVPKINQLVSNDRLVMETLDTSESEQIPQVVSQMKKEFDRIKSLMSEDEEEIANKVQAIMEQLEESQKIVEQAKQITEKEKEEEMIQKIKELVDLDQELVKVLNENEEIPKTVSQMKELVSSIEEIFPDEKDLVQAINAMSQCLRKAREIAEEETNEEMLKKIEKFKENQQKIGEIMQTDDYVDEIARIKEELNKIEEIVPEKDESIADAVKKMNDFVEQVKKVTEDEEDSLEAINRMKKNENQILKIINIENPNEIVENVQQIKEEIEKIEEIVPKKSESLSQDVKDYVDCVEQAKQIVEQEETEDLVKKIKQLKEHEKQLLETLQTDDSEEIPTKVKELNEEMTKIEEILPENRESVSKAVAEMKKFTEEVNKMTESEENEEALNKIQKLVDLEKNLMKTLQIDDENEIQSQVEQMKQEIESIQNILPQGDETISEKCSTIVSNLDEAHKTLEKEDHSEFMEKLNELNQMEKKLIETLKPDDSSEIPEIVQQMKSQLEQIDELFENKEDELPVRVRNLVHVVEEAKEIIGQNLIDELKKVTEREQDLMNTLNADNVEQVPEVVKEMKNKLDKIQEVIQNDDLVSQISELHEQIEKVKEIVNDEDLIKRCAEMAETEKNLMNILSLDDSKSIEEAVTQMKSQVEQAIQASKQETAENMIEEIKQLEENEKQILNDLEIENRDKIHERIEEMKQQLADNKRLIEEMQNLTDQENEKSLLKKVEQLVSNEKQIMELFDDIKAEQIPDTVKNQKQIIDQAEQLTEKENTKEMLKKIEQLVENEKKLLNIYENSKPEQIPDLVTNDKKIIQNAMQITEQETPQNMLKKIQQQNDIEKELMNILETEKLNSIPDLVTKQKQIIEQAVQLTEQNTPDSMIKKLQKLVENQKELMKLLQTENQNQILHLVSQNLDYIKKLNELMERQTPDASLKRMQALLNHIKLLKAQNDDEIPIRIKQLMKTLDLTNTEDPQKMLDALKKLLSDQNKLKKILNVEENIPETVQDLVKTISKAEKLTEANDSNRMLEKLANLVKTDSQLSNLLSVDSPQIYNQVKQMKSELDKIESLLNKEDDRDLPAKISSLQQQINELQNKEKQLKEAIGEDYQSEAMKLNKLLKETKAKDVDELRDKVQQLLQLVPSDNEDLSDVISRIQANNKVLDQLKELLKAETNEDSLEKAKEYQQAKDLTNNFLPDEIQRLIDIQDVIADPLQAAKDMKELRNKLKTEDVPSYVEDLVNKMNEIKKVIGKEPLVDEIKALKEERDQLKADEQKIEDCLLSNLSGDLPTEVAALVNQLNELQQAFEKIQLIVKAETIPGSIEAIKQIKSIENELVEMLELKSSSQLPKAVSTLKQLIRNLLQTTESENIEDLQKKVVNLVKQLKQAEDLLSEYPGDLKEKILQLLEYKANHESTLQVLKTVLEIIDSKSNSLRIKLPINEKMQQSIYGFVNQYKQAAEKMKSDIGDIMSKANKAGYFSDRLDEGVDAITAAAVSIAKQESIEEMQDALKSIRAIQEKQRAQSQKQIEKLKIKIEELNKEINEMQENSVVKDNEHFSEISEQKQINMKLNDDIDRIKRVNEEIFRCINKQPIDREFLFASLSEREIDTINKLID